MHGPDASWDKTLEHKRSLHGEAFDKTEAY